MVDEEIYFLEDDPSSFGCLVDWLFGQKSACDMDQGISPEEQLEHDPHWCRLAVLADKFGIDDLSESVASQYDLCLRSDHASIPCGAIISHIYEKTMDNSKLRELAVEKYAGPALAATWNPQSWVQGTSTKEMFDKQFIHNMELHMALHFGLCVIIVGCNVVHKRKAGSTRKGKLAYKRVELLYHY